MVQSSSQSAVNSIKMNEADSFFYSDLLAIPLKCEEVNKFNISERCDLVKNISDCQSSDGFINYVNIEYCNFSDSSYVEPMILYAFWISFLFVVLGITTDNFFCPALSVISKSLGLSDNVAGVTFLALGNGAPDIFASLAAVSQNRPEFVIGGLFGAGIFVTCVVAGSIMIGIQFRIDSLPFLRDIIFYLSASFWAFYVYYRQEIRVLDALGFIGMYFGYIFVVLGVPMIYKKLGQPCGALEEVVSDTSANDNDSGNSSGDQESLQSHPVSRRAVIGHKDTCNESSLLLPSSRHGRLPSPALIEAKEFLRAASPISYKQFAESGCYVRAFLIFRSPAVLCLKLTVPVIDLEKNKHNWNRPLNSLHCVLGPLFTVFAGQFHSITIGDRFPLWAVVLLVGCALATTMYLTTTAQEIPRFHGAFAFLGFVISIAWIYSVANEIVNILKAVGVVLDIPGAILGLTMLAWGNSVGDFVANLTVARKGFPVMGMSACFGGPLLNLLIGMGLPFAYLTLSTSAPVAVTYDRTVEMMSIFLFASLVCSMVAMVALKFKANRIYGVFLIILYLTFLIVAVLAISNVF